MRPDMDAIEEYVKDPAVRYDLRAQVFKSAGHHLQRGGVVRIAALSPRQRISESSGISLFHPLFEEVMTRIR
jgi:hypothetical protein